MQALVLVIDDEPDLRGLLTDLLTLHGYGVIVARHGQEGIDRLREHSPHLVVLA